MVSVVLPTQRSGFARRLAHPLARRSVEIVQINLGKRCNQACLHCHVEAGPTRTESLVGATADRLLELLAASEMVDTVDITGGAPELNPHFRRLVDGARALGLHVLDRCNLTVLLEPGQEDTAPFLADRQVEVVASLPCYTAENVDRQRGRGAFDKSITALRQLNELGYGQPDSDLALTLVYNPGGAFLPPPQATLDADYRERLERDFEIVFTRLYTITNMPIARFRTDLERSGKLEHYLRILREAYNPATLDGVMCRDLVSVSWDGRLFDCDFNQMLEIPVPGGRRTLADLESFDDLALEPIAVADHCFGCTAGAGSSCGGALT